MTIYQIRRATETTSHCYFTRKALAFFGQTMRDFKVYKQADGRFQICAPMRERHSGRVMGESVRYFNPANNQLELD